MMREAAIILTCLLLIILTGCSKKTHPTAAEPLSTTAPAVVKSAKKLTIKTAVPKVITVNDKVAKRSVDGRYYYDLEGHRYWRNKRDGKYYLFHKSMFDDPDFKSSGN